MYGMKRIGKRGFPVIYADVGESKKVSSDSVVREADPAGNSIRRVVDGVEAEMNARETDGDADGGRGLTDFMPEVEPSPFVGGR